MKRSLNYNQRSKKEENQKKKRIEKINIKNKIDSIKILTKKNKLSTALSEIKRLLEKYPDDDFVLFQYANILYILEEYELAKEEFQSIVDQNLDSKSSALYKLGSIAVLEGDYTLAKELFQHNIEESSYDEVLSVVSLSKLELKEGNFEESYAILERYANIDNDIIVIQRALILKTEKKYQEAYNLINNHNFKDNKYVIIPFYYIKACLEFELKLYDLSLESFDMILSGSKSKFYYKTLSEYNILNYKQRNFQKAISGCLEVINFSDDKYARKNLITLGNIYKMLGDIDLARSYYFKSISSKYHDKRGYIYLTDLAMIEKKYDKAKECIGKFLSTDSNDKEKNMANIRLALIAMKTGDIRKCQELMKQIDTKYLDGLDKDDYCSLKNHLKFITDKRKQSRGLYTYDQIKDYNLNRLKKHIDKIHTCENGDTSTFSKDIDLDDLILQIPELIEKGTMIGNHYFEYYEVDYDNVGIVNGNYSNTLRLVVFSETNMIITMYPVKDLICYNKKEKSVVKKKSQIDKFNQKYGKRDN